MPECRRPVEAPGQITAQLCDVWFDPPEATHIGPCANKNLPQTVRKREEFFAERERAHQKAQAELEELGSSHGRPSWESMSGDPMGGPPRPRLHPQIERREAERGRHLTETQTGGIPVGEPGSLESLPDQVAPPPQTAKPPAAPLQTRTDPVEW